MREMFPSKGKKVILGIGDDAAILRQDKKKKLFATTDILAEGVHFDLSYTSPYYLGRKAVAVNMSDIAAMGGIPRYALLSLALPRRLSEGFFTLFLRGVKSMCRSYGVALVGGDTSSSGNGVFISLSLLGEGEKFLTRTGARDGDRVFVTGTLGDSSLGLRILRKLRNPSLVSLNIQEKTLALRHLDPRPRLKEGRALVSRNVASAMIDVSDGLLSDLGHISEESRVGVRIWVERIPISRALCSLAFSYGQDPVALALSGGEDYEILFTVPEKNIRGGITSILGTRVTEIGVMDSSVHGIEVRREGKPYKFMGRGYEHFREPYPSQSKGECIPRDKGRERKKAIR